MMACLRYLGSLSAVRIGMAQALFLAENGMYRFVARKTGRTANRRQEF
jgi:hypothetical protein